MLGDAYKILSLLGSVRYYSALIYCLMLSAFWEFVMYLLVVFHKISLHLRKM